MKIFRKLMLLVLAVAMLACMTAGCESTQDKIDALAGSWTMVTDDTESQALILLENIDFYEEEIALVDMTALDYVKRVEFTTGMTYRFVVDADGTKTCVREFFEGVFNSLYENRAALNEVYGMEFDPMTREQFEQFYADLYEYADFTAMLDEFAGNAYDYEAFDEPLETGTYTIVGDQIMCTMTGDSRAESLGYGISGDRLTLTYSNDVEVYTKAG